MIGADTGLDVADMSARVSDRISNNADAIMESVSKGLGVCAFSLSSCWTIITLYMGVRSQKAPGMIDSPTVVFSTCVSKTRIPAVQSHEFRPAASDTESATKCMRKP